MIGVIIPVKPVAIGKSRLRASLADADDLVTAIALDTIAAALGAVVPGADVIVVVVTDDPVVAAEATALGALVTPDAPDAGLNAAIRHGETVLSMATTRAALTADLPALRSAELAGAIVAFEARPDAGRAHVIDHLGTGTTTLFAAPGVPMDPHFGVDSAAAHAASGALALGGDWPTLRLDVDTHTDLQLARQLGLGPRTARALSAAQV